MKLPSMAAVDSLRIAGVADVCAPAPGRPFVLYVTDVYCGWCHGFGERLREFEEANKARLLFRIISGGLFVGSKVGPINAFPHIPEANARIARLTGACFGAPYQKLVEQGSFVMDSLQAAAGLAALRAQDPSRGVHFAHRLQKAFYEQGLDLAEASTVLEIAASEGIDVGKTEALLNDGKALAAAKEDFDLARRLGVSAFPTLLFVNGQAVHKLPTHGTTLAFLNKKIDELITQAC